MATTNQPGQPISALPLAGSVSLTDTLLGIITKAGATSANQVSILVLAQGISEAIGLDDAVAASEAAAASAASKAEAAGSAASDAVTAARGNAGGMAALDALGQLALTDGKSLIAALKVLPSAQSTSARLATIIPFDGETQIQVDDTITTLGGVAGVVLNLTGQRLYTDQAGDVRAAKTFGVLPDDVVVRGGLYLAGSSPLPPGLSSSGNLILTDGTVHFQKTFNNGGVLCALPE